MFTVRNVLPLLLVVLLLCGLSFGATLITVKSGGGGDYTTISAALEAAKGPNEPNANNPPARWPITIEVQDSGTYVGNLQFPEVNDLTLKAGTGFFPTITVTGTGGTPPADVNEYYIDINSPNTTLQGFKINFSGTAYLVDNNSCMVHVKGGASTIRDCNIYGPTDVTDFSRGIAGAATIDNVEISQCGIGVLCDANWFSNGGFNYSIAHSRIYNNNRFGLLFNDCNAVVDDCVIENSGTPSIEARSNIVTEGPNSLLLNLLVKNSLIRDIRGTGRNITLESRGTVDINDCIIRDAHFDEILQYQGTLNLKRCILKNTSGGNNGANGGCVNVNNGGGRGNCYTNLDHCTLEMPPVSEGGNDQWAIFTVDPCAHVAVTNSILTGPQGFFVNLRLNTAQGAYFTSNYNDNDCNNPIQGQSFEITPGLNDLSPKQNPFYVQTTSITEGTDANEFSIHTFYALQPYSPVIGRGSSGSNMGARGVEYGHEKWPADIDKVYGVDVNDLQVFASRWLSDSNVVPPGPNEPLENFEGYTTTLSLDPNWTVPGWTWLMVPHYPQGSGPLDIDPCYTTAGTSTLTLLTTGAYEGSKALQWVYDVNKEGGAPPCQGRFTEILMTLNPNIKFNNPDINGVIDINIFPNATGQPGSRFNQLKVMVRRHAGNSPTGETFMYVKFLDKTRSSPTTSHNKEDEIAHMVGGSTDANAGEWVPWNSSLTDMHTEGILNTPLRLTKISGIVFGIAAQPDGPWGVGQGTIDIDKIELVDTPGCTGYPLGDLYLTNGVGDCRVTFRDYIIFANYWMDGK